MTTIFADAQPLYAEHGIATFPVTATKMPAVRGYLQTGLISSKALAAKFAEAPALGFATNKGNGITVLDIDTTNDNVLADALNRHGPTPLIARTGSGKFHAYYRNSGERRRIRPWSGREIDLLGKGGMVIAPPSTLARRSYTFIEGTLDDVSRLPILRNLDLPEPSRVKRGDRNNALFRHCMRAAHHCDTLDDLLDVARTFNDECLPPMEDGEVTATTQSAWAYIERGQNWFGQHGAWLPSDELDKMIVGDQDALLLLAFLRRHQGPEALFMIANDGLADKLGWRRQRVAAARSRLIELDHISVVRQAWRGHPALYRWAKRNT
jgi:Bifunctional DNA primase/polymerase, N-terminal/Primase C terminal 1 (PriCT-1)